MKKLGLILLCTSALTLNACGAAGEQWLNPDTTFAKMGGPDVKGINATQEDIAKEAAAAGDYARAAKFYELLVATDKGTPEEKLRYRLGFANATRRIGDNERALAMFDQLTRTNPGNLDAMEGKGLSLMALGKSTDASRVFSDIMEKDSTRWRTLNALGILFVTKDMIPEAMAYYTEALKQSPDNPALLNNVGLTLGIDRKFDRAIDALDQASRLSKNPNQRKQIELNEAMVFGVSGDLDKARELASKYFDGPALDNNMGLYAHLAKDDGLAKTYMNMALSQSPTFYERAWDNLDIINDADHTPDPVSSKKQAAPAPAKLPKYK